MRARIEQSWIRELRGRVCDVSDRVIDRCTVIEDKAPPGCSDKVVQSIRRHPPGSPA